MAIAFHSGYGHTAVLAEAVARGAQEAGAQVDDLNRLGYFAGAAAQSPVDAGPEPPSLHPTWPAALACPESQGAHNMSSSENIALARRLYDSKGDPAVLAEVLSTDIVWDVTPGFPQGGVYTGLASVGQDFFGGLLQQVGGIFAEADQLYADDEGHVFALGHYHVTSKSGKVVTPRFIHLWTVRDGKLAHLQQAADSYVARQALEA